MRDLREALLTVARQILGLALILITACDASDASAPRGPVPAPESAKPESAKSAVIVAPEAEGDPMAKKLAEETLAHKTAPDGGYLSVVPPEDAPRPVDIARDPTRPPPPPFDVPPLDLPIARPWQSAGVLVLVTGGEDDAKVQASSLRWELSRNGAGAWTNTVDAIHVYEKLWVVRMSPVDLAEATHVCRWLDRPKPKDPSWLAANPRRVCRFSSNAVLTSKTEFVLIDKKVVP